MLASLGLVLLAAADVQAIVRKAIDREIDNQRQLANYTWQEDSVVKFGNKSPQSKVRDHFSIDGTTYTRLVEKNGRPLPPAEARKEQEKMDREILKRKNESDSARRKRLAGAEKERREGVKFREEVIQAFDFRLEGEETLNGFPAWKIAGTPRAGFKPKSRDGKVLAKIRGHIWVHRELGEWIKFEVETLDKISFGWMVATVAPGARMSSQQMHVNGEFWHPEWLKLQLNGRGLWVKIALNVEERYRNFRKFSAESRIVTEP